MTGHVYSVGQQVSFGGRVVTYLKRTGVFTITKLFFAGLIPLATEPPVGPQGRSGVIMPAPEVRSGEIDQLVTPTAHHAFSM